MPRITTERLGVEPKTGYAVWVVWFTERLVDSLATLLVPWPCPECHHQIDLYRRAGVVERVRETPNCGSVSDRCPRCQARLHFDATPERLRASLRWPKVAVGAASLEPPRTVAAPPPQIDGNISPADREFLERRFARHRV